MHTKQGLSAARAKGKILGRPKGSGGNSKWKDKDAEIIEFINKGIPLRSVWRLIGIGTYEGFYTYCKNNKKIKEAWRVMKDTKTSLIALINEKGKKRW